MRAGAWHDNVGVGVAQRRREEVEPDEAAEIAQLGRYRLRVARDWSREFVEALTDDAVTVELRRLDAEREPPGSSPAA